MLLILNDSTGALVTVAISNGSSAAPDGGSHRESMCSQAKHVHIPHYMLREVKLQFKGQPPA